MGLKGPFSRQWSLGLADCRAPLWEPIVATPWHQRADEGTARNNKRELCFLAVQASPTVVGHFCGLSCPCWGSSCLEKSQGGCVSSAEEISLCPKASLVFPATSAGPRKDTTSSYKPVFSYFLKLFQWDQPVLVSFSTCLLTWQRQSASANAVPGTLHLTNMSSRGHLISPSRGGWWSPSSNPSCWQPVHAVLKYFWISQLMLLSFNFCLPVPDFKELLRSQCFFLWI